MIQDLMLVLQPATLYCLNSRLRMLLCGVYCCMHNVLHNVYSLCTARTTASCHLRSHREKKKKKRSHRETGLALASYPHCLKSVNENWVSSLLRLCRSESKPTFFEKVLSFIFGLFSNHHIFRTFSAQPPLIWLKLHESSNFIFIS